jgi:hypothetical protein
MASRAFAALVLAWLGSSPALATPYREALEPYRDVGAGLLSWDEVLTIPLGPSEPTALAVAPDGRLLVAEGAVVRVLDAGGAPLARIDAPGRVGALAFGPAGELYLGLADHVEVQGADGELRAWASMGEGALITSLTAGSGSVWAADAGNKLVWRFHDDGRLAGILGRDGPAGVPGFVVPSPYFDVAWGAGALWAANPGRNRLERWSPEDDQRLGHWGAASMEIEGFGGCCNPSHFAVLPDGSLVTAEKGLPRVKVHRADGSLDSVVAGPRAFDPDAVGLDLAVDAQGRVVLLDPSIPALRIFARRSPGTGGSRER